MTEQKDEIRLKELLSAFGEDKQKEIIEILHRDQIRYHKEQLALYGVAASLPSRLEMNNQAEKEFEEMKIITNKIMFKHFRLGFSTCYEWMLQQINNKG